MTHNFINFIIGYVKIKYSCSRPEAVLDELKTSVNILYCKKTDASDVVIEIPSYDSKRAAKIFDLYNAEYEILGKNGLPYFLKRKKDRVGIIIGLFISAFFIYYLSGTVWEINVVSDFDTDKNKIISNFQKLGFTYGTFYRNTNMDMLANRYILLDENVSWISVNMNGVIANVEVKLADKKPEKCDKITAKNIVARCDGIIEQIYAYGGGKAVSNGELVAKGQLLISSFFETRTVGPLLKSARGKVFAKTEPYIETVVYKNRSEVYEKYRCRMYKLSVLGNDIKFGFVPEVQNTILKKKTEKKPLNLFGFVKLPAKLYTETYYICDTKNMETPPELAKAKHEENYNDFLKKCERAEKFSEEELFFEDDEKYIINEKLSCVENIALEVPFIIDYNT